MNTKWHLATSVAAGAGAALAVGVRPREFALLVGIAAVLGTLLDLDHFPIARLRAGDWRHLRFAATHPRVALFHQDEIFEAGAVGPLTRLLSHVLLGGLLVAALWFAGWRFLAAFSAGIVYLHVVGDLLAGVRAYES